MIPSRAPPSFALDEQRLSDTDYRRIVKLVYETTGIVLDESRKALVVGRLAPRLRATGVASYREYLELLETNDADGEEMVRFVNRITTNKTSFFREAHHFTILHDLLVDRKRRAETDASLRKVRIWSAGCSTGEEPYTIALTVAEALGAELGQWDVKILATDIDTDVLAFARRGIYPRERVQGVPGRLGWAIEEVVSDGRVGRRVRDDIRRLITFQPLNFMDPTWPIRGSFDFLFCRNVTIYFDRPTQERLYRRFASLLVKEGSFFAGHSENITWLPDVFALAGPTVYKHPGAPKNGAAGAAPLRVISTRPAPRRVPAVIHSAPPPRLSLVPPSGLSVPPSGFSVPPSGFSMPPSGFSVPPSGFSVPPPRLSVAPPSGLSLRPPGLERGAVPEVAIQAGGVVASKTPLLIKTTLGSCISVCLYDPVTRMGGMNHFMLPGSPSDTDGSTRFGVHAMEVLINRLLKLGASRDRLVAKIVGGCSVVEFVGVTVAERNLRFVEDFLAMEGFEVKSRRVGGTHAMEVRFRTDTGEAFVRTVNDPGVTKRALRQDADYRERFALPAPAQAPAPTSTESTSDDDGITYFK